MVQHQTLVLYQYSRLRDLGQRRADVQLTSDSEIEYMFGTG